VEGEGESPGEDSMVERAGLNAASGSPLKFIGAGLSYSFIPIERSCQVQHIYRNLCGRYYCGFPKSCPFLQNFCQ